MFVTCGKAGFCQKAQPKWPRGIARTNPQWKSDATLPIFVKYCCVALLPCYGAQRSLAVFCLCAQNANAKLQTKPPESSLLPLTFLLHIVDITERSIVSRHAKSALLNCPAFTPWSAAESRGLPRVLSCIVAPLIATIAKSALDDAVQRQKTPCYLLDPPNVKRSVFRQSRYHAENRTIILDCFPQTKINYGTKGIKRTCNVLSINPMCIPPAYLRHRMVHPPSQNCGRHYKYRRSVV